MKLAFRVCKMDGFIECMPSNNWLQECRHFDLLKFHCNKYKCSGEEEYDLLALDT